MPASQRCFANYLVFRDEQPFLIINATLDHVLRMVEGFGRDGAHRFSFRPV